MKIKLETYYVCKGGLAMNEEVSQLLEQIDLRKDELLELTKTLIRFETPARRRETQMRRKNLLQSF